MASLQKKGDTFYCQFLYHGKRRTFTVGTVPQLEAEAKARQVEYLLMRLKQGLITIPTGCDIVSFIMHDGKPPEGQPATSNEASKKGTLSSLRDQYIAAISGGSVEENTLYTIRIHFSHLCGLLGEKIPLTDIKLGTLQKYVDDRQKKVSPVTIKKELSTLRASWNWALLDGMVSGQLSLKGLKYRKTEEKSSFLTIAEINRKIAEGQKPKDLWAAAYLTVEETKELLDYVRVHAVLPWVYPMFVFAAHTGARRSEIIRVMKSDVDFNEDCVIIREKKRAVGERTTRRVPLSATLAEALKQWLAVHPGGAMLFCQAGEIPRSKKRSRTTGHQGEKTRPSSLKARNANVKSRSVKSPEPLSLKETYHHFKFTLAGSKWQNLKGWHSLRHSFISACAAKGVDARMVEAWSGHMSPQMSKRYTHLRPDRQKEAINGVFE